MRTVRAFVILEILLTIHSKVVFGFFRGTTLYILVPQQLKHKNHGCCHVILPIPLTKVCPDSLQISIDLGIEIFLNHITMPTLFHSLSAALEIH